MRIALIAIVCLAWAGCTKPQQAPPTESIESQVSNLQSIIDTELELWKRYRKMRQDYQFDILPGGMTAAGQEAIKANRWDDLEGKDKDLWLQYSKAVEMENLHNENLRELSKKITPLREKLGIKR